MGHEPGRALLLGCGYVRYTFAIYTLWDCAGLTFAVRTAPLCCVLAGFFIGLRV